MIRYENCMRHLFIIFMTKVICVFQAEIPPKKKSRTPDSLLHGAKKAKTIDRKLKRQGRQIIVDILPPVGVGLGLGYGVGYGVGYGLDYGGYGGYGGYGDYGGYY